MQAQYIEAIALTVTDIKRSQNFYINALGFELIAESVVDAESALDTGANGKSDICTATLRLGDERIKLRQYLDIQGKAIPTDSRSNDLWFQHLAIVVSDMDKAYFHLQSFDFAPISTAPQTFPPGNIEAAYIRAFKFKDPDGHDLELIWYPPDKGQTKWHTATQGLFLGIDHSAIAVSNTEQSIEFYRDRLGMKVGGGSLNWRETQARLDNLPNAVVKVTSLRANEGGIGIELLNYIYPTDGRPMPTDWQSSDIAYMQFEIITSGIEQEVRIADPDGHHLLLKP